MNYTQTKDLFFEVSYKKPVVITGFFYHWVVRYQTP